MSITAKIIEKLEHKTATGYSSSSSMRMYQQSMPLPKDADEATINMSYIDGKLVVHVEKKKASNTSKSLPNNNDIKHKNKSEENNTSINKMQVGDNSSMS